MLSFLLNNNFATPFVQNNEPIKIKFEIYETKNNYQIYSSRLNFHVENIKEKISKRDNTYKIDIEFINERYQRTRYGIRTIEFIDNISKTFKIPEDVDSENIEMSQVDRSLFIIFPKKELPKNEIKMKENENVLKEKNEEKKEMIQEKKENEKIQEKK
jgi:hypothetical protein